MYSRYFPQGEYEPLHLERPEQKRGGAAGFLPQLPKLDSVLKALHLDRFDKGDILLILVLLFLYLESDDEDWFIILALVVVMGL